MSTNLTAPVSFTQEGSAGMTLSYILAQLTLVMQDTLGDDVIQFMGEPIDLTAMGTDTKRVPVLSNLAFQRRFSASSDETTLGSASGYTADYWSAAVAQYDLASTDTVKNRVLGLPGVSVGAAELQAFLPQNYLATMRYLACVAGSSFSNQTVGSTGAALNADDIFDLAAAATRKLGAGALGAPVCFLDPEQFITAREAFRSEPAYVQNLGAMQQIQRIQAGQNLGDVFGLGFGVLLTDDVQQSGGAYRGFCGSVGSVARVKADPSVANLPGAVNPMYFPDQGMVVYQLLQAANSATFGWQALAFLGAAQASATSTLQIRVTSVV